MKAVLKSSVCKLAGCW